MTTVKPIIIKKVLYEDTYKNTEYYLTDKGHKLNTILYDMTLYGLDELDCVDASDDKKQQIRDEYKEIFNI